MNCEELKSRVLHWMGEEIECKVTGQDRLAITLPLLKPNGDAIEIGLEATQGLRWKLSDLGDTHATLYLAGVNLSEDYARADEFRQIITDHGIDDTEEELSVEVTTAQLVDGVFDFVHAIQSALSLQLTLKARKIEHDFPGIVAKFLHENHASFEVPSHPFEGLGGRWPFNFMLNGKRPPTIVKAISAGSKAQAVREAELSVFQIRDVRGTGLNIDAAVITDDEGEKEKFWQQQAMRVFGAYSIPAYKFNGDRDEVKELAAKYAA